MVPYVRLSFYKHYKNGLKYISKDEALLNKLTEINKDDIRNLPIEDDLYKSNEQAYDYALDMTVKELNQAVEGMYHNLK